MTSLYGIESEDDCRAKIDELLELHARAEHAMEKESGRQLKKESIRLLKDRLEEYYKAGNTNEGERRMSSVERRYFWPAVRDAYVKAPKLNSPQTWNNGLYEIHSSLTYYRQMLSTQPDKDKKP